MESEAVNRGFTVFTGEQRTDEWRQARLGRVTGSRAADVVATLKSGGEAAARRDYRMELIIERLTGQSCEDGFVTKEMQRGIELEPFAFAAYEANVGRVVDKVGFVSSIDRMTGSSPDGVIGDFEGILEVKCPKSATHVGYLRAGVLPKDYEPQVTHNLWVTGARWCDFVSFDDRLPLKLQFFRVLVVLTDEQRSAYAAQVGRFLTQVDLEEAELRRMAS